MAGLVSATHVLLLDGPTRKSWMPGTRPGMTKIEPCAPLEKKVTHALQTTLILRGPCSARGASTGDAGLAEQAGCAAGDQARGPGADEVVRLCGACAPGLVSRALGRLRDTPWGHYDPCARSSLQWG